MTTPGESLGGDNGYRQIFSDFIDGLTDFIDEEKETPQPPEGRHITSFEDLTPEEQLIEEEARRYLASPNRRFNDGVSHQMEQTILDLMGGSKWRMTHEATEYTESELDYWRDKAARLKEIFIPALLSALITTSAKTDVVLPLWGELAQGDSPQPTNDERAAWILDRKVVSNEKRTPRPQEYVERRFIFWGRYKSYPMNFPRHDWTPMADDVETITSTTEYILAKSGFLYQRNQARRDHNYDRPSSNSGPSYTRYEVQPTKESVLFLSELIAKFLAGKPEVGKTVVSMIEES